MLKITVPDTEQFNQDTNEFVLTKGGTLILEHSLLSLSKWESKWCKPFISKTPMTYDELIDYIRCMTLNSSSISDDNIYTCIPVGKINEIQNYINAPMTATTFPPDRNPHGNRNGELITAEIIYWEMVEFGIPFECEKWHLNRLLTLIHVCSVKQSPNQKMSMRDICKQNTALNTARKRAHHTKG